VMMLVFTTRSIIRVFCSSSSSPDAMQTNMIPVVVHPQPPVETPPLSAYDNLKPAAFPLNQPAVFPSSQPAAFAAQTEIMRQREKARAETIAELKREAQEQAGTSGVPKEVLQKLEQSDPYVQ